MSPNQLHFFRSLFVLVRSESTCMHHYCCGVRNRTWSPQGECYVRIGLNVVNSLCPWFWSLSLLLLLLLQFAAPKGGHCQICNCNLANFLSRPLWLKPPQCSRERSFAILISVYPSVLDISLIASMIRASTSHAVLVDIVSLVSKLVIFLAMHESFEF